MPITTDAKGVASRLKLGPAESPADYRAFKRSATVCIASGGTEFDVTLSHTLEKDGWGVVKIVDLENLAAPPPLNTWIENNALDLWVVNLSGINAHKEVQSLPSLIFDFLCEKPAPTLVLTPDIGVWSREILDAFKPALSSGAADFIPLSESLLLEGLEKHAEVWEEFKTRIDILHARFLQNPSAPKAPAAAARNTPASVDEETASLTDAFAARTLAPFPVAPEPLSGRVVTELHHPESGRLDAKRIARFFGLRAATLASIVGTRPQTLGKTPDAPALQEKLAPFYFVATSLLDMFGTPEAARAWLNLPNASSRAVSACSAR